MDKNFPRLLDTLRQVPRRGKLSTADIHRRLGALGHEVSRRTVQRDLEALARHYGLVCDERDKAFGWSWPRDAQGPLVPALDVPTSLALLMADQEWRGLVPPAVQEALAPWLAEARRTLAARGPSRAGRWLRKTAFEPLGPPLMPAKLSPAVMEAVSEALFAEVQIRAEYRSAQSTDHRSVHLHPLGLIRTGLVTYLVACFDGYDDPRLLALHRLRRVKVLDAPASAPLGFDLRQFIRAGGLNLGEGPTVKLRLRMTGPTAAHLHETPLSEDQQISPCPDDPDWVIVTATVADSPRLEWWIRGFGEMAQRLG